MIACGSGLLFFLRCLGSRFCALPWNSMFML
jgi:hypothetical protein